MVWERQWTRPDGEGKKPPSASALADMLADRFLGGKYKGYPLNQIAEYAINESDLGTVQAFIRDIFALFEPSKAHELMTTFRWDGLATTNYDLNNREGLFEEFRRPRTSFAD